MEGEIKVKDEPPDSFSYQLEDCTDSADRNLQENLPLDVFHRQPCETDSKTGTLSCLPHRQVSVNILDFPLKVDPDELSRHEAKDSHNTAGAVKAGRRHAQNNRDQDQDSEMIPDDPRRVWNAKYERYKRKRKFCPHWLLQFPWLRYDAGKNKMFCKLCEEYKSDSPGYFVKEGSNSFKIISLQSHPHCKDHQRAVQAQMFASPADTTRTPVLKPKTEYMLRKFLQLFPWLSYKAEVNMVTCSICQKHGTDSVFLQLTVENVGLDHKLIRCHIQSKNHCDAEMKEVQSWQGDWDNQQQQPGAQSSENTDKVLDEIGRAHGDMKGETLDLVPSTDEEFIADRDSCQGQSNQSPTLHAFGTFQKDWLVDFPWIEYNESTNEMKCFLCAKHGKNNRLGSGTRVFKKYTLVDHAVSVKHCAAISAELVKQEQPLVEDTDASDSSVPDLLKSSSVESNSSSEDSGLGAQDAEPHGLPDASIQAHQFALTNMIQLEPLWNSRDIYPRGKRLRAGGSCKGKYESKRSRTFLPSWKDQFKWLEYDSAANVMYCTWCRQLKFSNSYATGTNAFRIDGLRAHCASGDHQKAENCSHLLQEQYPTLPTRLDMQSNSFSHDGN